MNSNDFTLMKNIANNVGKREYIDLKDPAHLSGELGRSLIVNLYTS